jgi:hypothetical protein
VNFLAILLAIGSVAGAIAFLGKDKTENSRDVYEDYKVILEAMTAYKDAHKQYAKSLDLLEAYVKDQMITQYAYYQLSLDGKYLIVDGLTPDEAKQIVNLAGGTSYINGKLAYLTLRRFNDVSQVVPIAHFAIKPDENITTTTPLTYDISGCVTENNEIIEKKWENKNPVFLDPGMYTIRLKIKDKNGNWSDFYEKEIRVIEEQGIQSIKGFDGSLFLTYRNGRSLSLGKNEYGQLGIGSLTLVPELTYSTMYDGVVQVACGEAFNVFRMYDGSVYTAGDNRHGELASGDKSAHKLMNQIWGLENVKQVSVGKKFGAALDYNGDVFVWGDNSDGQLMNPDFLDSPYPIKLQGVTGVKEIACGTNFGLALRYDGTVIGWGDNSYGQLALGYKGAITEPMITLYKNAKHVAAGDRFSLVVTETGKVYGAGNNAYGQLGSREKNEFLFPEEVLKVKEVSEVSACESLVVALTQTGKALIWGNFNGPSTKPIYEAVEIPGVMYIKAFANTGKKCYFVDGKSDLITVSDLSGKFEKRKIHENFSEIRELMATETE